MRPLVALALCAVLLAACGAPTPPARTEAEIRATIVAEIAVPTSQPTIAPTAKALVAGDLEPLLVQAGDLPLGFEPAQVKGTQPQAYITMKVPPPDGIIMQLLQQDGKPAGYITVSLYADETARSDALTRIANDVRGSAKMGTGAITPLAVGENGVAVSKRQNIPGVDLAFAHCQAVIHVYFGGVGVDLDSATAYAQRLDGRLQKAIC